MRACPKAGPVSQSPRRMPNSSRFWNNLQSKRPPLPRIVSRQSPEHHRRLREASGTDALPSVWRGGFSSVDRLCERIDIASRSWHRAPARTRRPRRDWCRSAQDDSSIAHGVACNRGVRSCIGSVIGLAKPAAGCRLAAGTFFSGRVGDQDELAGSVLQCCRSNRHRDYLRTVARSPSYPAQTSRRLDAGQRQASGGQHRRPTRAPRSGRGTSGPHAVDVECGECGRQRISEACEYRPGL